ncbi:hypothetical protein [Roseomonas elaeocarpi]|uniref:Glycosyltransferase RgtA/B/C/D-like domain-containing protein n=1 Tax=Roseomonas elaeocarpi TaxID=907779 RepID=A0ABV6JSG3_9PROT
MQMSDASTRGRHGRLGQAWDVLSGLLILLACVVAFVPLLPLMPQTGLDSAWAFAVNAAVGQGLVFGRDLVFTFGPYAADYTLQYHPATDTLALWSSLLLAVSMAGGLCVLSARRGRVAALVLAVFLATAWLRDPLFFLLPALFLVLACRVAGAPRPAVPPADPRPTASPRMAVASLVLLILSLALLPLIKGTFAAASGAVLGLVVLLLLLRRRWRPAVAMAVLFAVAMPLFWWLAGQPPLALPGFFLAQGPIISGYTEAMSVEGPFWQVLLAAAAAILILLFNLPVHIRWPAGTASFGTAAPASRDWLGEAALWLGLAALLFLAFKAGLVRHDGHVVITGVSLAILPWLLVLGRTGRGPWLGLAVGLLCWAALVWPEPGTTPSRYLATTYRDAVRGGLARLGSRDPFGQQFDATLAQIRRENPLPPLQGTIDSYSTGQSVLLAHGLRWSPRPVLQSYSAYLPELAEANRRHLEGSGAPDNLLFAIEPVDDRLPSLEDGLSWPDLLVNYEAVALSHERALLRRRPAAERPPPMLGDLLGAGRYAMGQPIALPGGQTALWARVSVKPTLLGRLVAMLYKPPQLRVRVALINGKQEEYRFVPGMAEAGFLISPVVGDTTQFLSLTLPGAGLYEGRIPVSFAILGSSGSRWLWQNAVDVGFRAVRLPQSETVRALIFPPPLREEPAERPLLTGHGKCFLDTLDGHDFPRSGPMRLDGRRRLAGWGFLELPAAVDPEAMRLVLTEPDGVAHVFPVRTSLRPDVGVYFGQQQLNRIGFEALVDVAGMPGRYGVELEMRGAGRVQTCTLYPTAEVPP